MASRPHHAGASDSHAKLRAGAHGLYAPVHARLSGKAETEQRKGEAMISDTCADAALAGFDRAFPLENKPEQNESEAQHEVGNE